MCLAELRAPLPHVHIDIGSVARSVALPSLYPPPPARDQEEGEGETYRSKEQGGQSIWKLVREDDEGFVAVPAPVGEKARPFGKGDGFDLYVDAARFLPVCVCVCVCVCARVRVCVCNTSALSCAMRFSSVSPSSLEGSISVPSCHSLKEFIMIMGGVSYDGPCTDCVCVCVCVYSLSLHVRIYREYISYYITYTHTHTNTNTHRETHIAREGE